MNKEVNILNFGLKDYKDTWDIQEDLFSKILEIKSNNRRTTKIEETPNTLILVEHPPVYTIGKNGVKEHLLISEERLKMIGAECYNINRGGDITFHGPGQLVGYPILDLENFFTDIGKYLRTLEEIVICILADYGIKGERSAGETGVWIAPNTSSARKICALGVRASRWVTMHGFALNVTTDLTYFDYIIPCGIKNKGVTSIAKELRKTDNLYLMEEVQEKFIRYFSEFFGAIPHKKTEANASVL
ncbi:MAG: lipoyl(octanoyl) transferase LipB [Bacteroidetes bacterium]|jgi:lipoyl(octanoyl) transferase|nr:lipoyl(octanoyl) transferase LipB [Bacteroidota bacterium]